MTGIVIDDGTGWVPTSALGDATVVAAAIEGTSTSQLGNFASATARDFNLQGSGINEATLTANSVAKQYLNADVRYMTLNRTTVFTARYGSAYDVTPSVATIAGPGHRDRRGAVRHRERPDDD